MKTGKAYTLNYRRKREGKTNYRTRLKLLSSKELRVVVRKSLSNIIVQIVKFDKSGDKVLVSASTRELLKYGWKGHRGNVSSAFLLGLLCGMKAKKNGFTSGILDIGLHPAIKGSMFFSVVRGLSEAGFSIPVGDEIMPEDNRIFGKHIESYAKTLSGSEKYKKQFSSYIKAGLKPEEISKHILEVKNNINSKWQ